MHTPANPTSRRIGQLIRMVSSDQPGEAAAAAQALNRTLTSAGLDIHALAQVAETGLRRPYRRRRHIGGHHRPPQIKLAGQMGARWRWTSASSVTRPTVCSGRAGAAGSCSRSCQASDRTSRKWSAMPADVAGDG